MTYGGWETGWIWSWGHLKIGMLYCAMSEKLLGGKKVSYHGRCQVLHGELVGLHDVSDVV